jgi:hypothetical protein
VSERKKCVWEKVRLEKFDRKNLCVCVCALMIKIEKRIRAIQKIYDILSDGDKMS